MDDIIAAREEANNRLRDELSRYLGTILSGKGMDPKVLKFKNKSRYVPFRLVDMCHELDKGRVPEGFEEMLRSELEMKNH